LKLKLTYLPEEEREAAAALAVLLRRFPGARTRKSARHPPFLHLYLTTKKPETPCGSKEKP